MVTEEFERLYNEHAAALLAFLEYRTGNVELAKDVHADTFERVLKTRWRFDPRKGSQKTWLYTIALNLLRDHARRAAAEGRAVEKVGHPVPGGRDELDSVERRDELQRALATLAEEERDAIALRFGADLTVPEMAKLLGEPLTTVEGRVYRALRKLRERL